MWRVSPGQSLRHHSWDNEQFVLYNDLSGDTHLLDAAAIEILTLLQAAPATTAGLAQTLGLARDDATQLATLLDELAALDLIESPPC